MNRRAFLRMVGAVTVVAPLARKLDWILPDALVPVEEATLPVIEGAVPPVGTVFPFAGAAIPDGWLLCDGQAISVAKYPHLAQVLGDKFGRDGMKVKVPDMRAQPTPYMGRTVLDRPGQHPISVNVTSRYLIRGA